MKNLTKHYSFESVSVSLLIIAFSCTAIWISLSFEEMPPILKRGIQPADFPQLVCVLIILMTLFMMWRDPIKVLEPMGSKTLGSIVLMGVFVAISTIDLFLALGIFASVLAFYWGERHLLHLFGVGLFVPMAVFFLFDQVFEIRFPRGLLTNFWYG